jgi:hypothetical protein
LEHKLIKSIFCASFVWTAGMILTQGALRADTIVYGVTFEGGIFETRDLNNRAFTLIPAPPLNDYELGVYGGILFGDSPQCGCLFQLNPSTGVPTFAPTKFNQNNNGFGLENGFGSTTAGVFVVGAAMGGDNYLYSVNTTTGAPTLIGPTGITAGVGTGFLSASNDSGTLYWEVQANCQDTLYSLNTSTGAATPIGTAAACVPSNTPTGSPDAMVLTGGTLWADFKGGGFGTINTSTGGEYLVTANMFPNFAGLAPFPLTPVTPIFVGSMGHLAAEENWTTTFTLVNKGGAPSQAQLSFFGDASDPSGNGPLALPLVFSQPLAKPLLTASYSQTLAANASMIVATGGPQTPPGLVGSAQVSATGAVDGFAIFHLIPGAQEAVVPLETRNASSYLLAFDNTSDVVLTVSVANVSAEAASIGLVIRDVKGVSIGPPGAAISLGGNGHTSFMLSDPVQGFAVTAGIRGTIEFDTPPSGRISVLGARTTPLGATKTLTTIPPLANVGTNGGSFPFVASGGDGWQTTFVLVNTGTDTASATLRFFDPTGNPMSMPVSYPQTGNGPFTTTPSITHTLPSGASLTVLSAGSAMLLEGSAQLSTSGNISGFAIFRYNPTGQEAVVPIESRNVSGYLLAFDNTSGIATSISVNNVTSGQQQVTIPVVVRDDSGNLLGQHNLLMAPNGEFSGVLAQAPPLGAVLFPETANIRGTIEFDTPSGAQIGVLGVRSPPTRTYTTLPALAK